jgi:hypothetical protein
MQNPEGVSVLSTDDSRRAALDARQSARLNHGKGVFVDGKLLRRRAAQGASLALVSALCSVVGASAASAATPSGIQGSGHNAVAPSGIQGTG